MAKTKSCRLHDGMLYPTVRVRTEKVGGSGTVIWSKMIDDEYVTFVLTNHHVIKDLITVKKEYDPMIRRDVPKEIRGNPTVEEFRYRDGSRAIGTLSVESDIMTYNEREDLALLRLATPDEAKHIAKLPREGREKEIRIFDAVWCVGASLGHPPIATQGTIVSMDDKHQEKELWMSTAQTIFGNSGGSVWLADTLEWIGIPSLVAVAAIGWSLSAITHMGYLIPFPRIYEWLREEYYHFIFDDSVTFEQCEIDRKQAKEDLQRKLDVRTAQDLAGAQKQH